MVENRSASDKLGRLFSLATFVIVIAVLYFAKEILLPLLLAILLSFVLTGAVSRLERLRIGRIPAVLVVCAIAFSLIGGVGWLASNQLIELSARLPDYKDNLISKIHNIQTDTGQKLGKAKKALEDIGRELSEEADMEPQKTAESEKKPELAENVMAWLNPERKLKESNEAPLAVKVVELPPSPLNQIRNWLGPLVGPLSTAGMVIVLVTFILIMREDLRNRMLQLIGASNIYATTEVIEEAASRLSSYFRMQLLINVSYGIVVAICLSLLGVPNAILWGVLGAMLRFLPYVGPWIAAVMPITLSIAISEGWSQPLMTVGFFIAIEIIVNNVLEPWLYGSSSGVSSLGVILAAIFWTWLWGPVGLVLAMPLTVCLVVLGKYIPQLEFLSVILGDHATLKPHEQLYQRLLTADDDEAAAMTERYLKSAQLTEFYDDVLIPALQLAEEDRHANRLSEHQEKLVNQSARELVDDFGLRSKKEESDHQENGDVSDKLAIADQGRKVLCVPVGDQADETAAQMAAQVLNSAGWLIEVQPLNALASETIERFESGQFDLALFIVLPPLGIRPGRYLCKRLRHTRPDLPIVAALLNGETQKKSRQRLLSAGANTVVTKLQNLIQVVNQAIHFDGEPHASPASRAPKTKQSAMN